MVWVWAGVFIATLIFEILTEELVSIWFSVGGFVAFVLALFKVNNLTIQILVFVGVSVVLLFSARRFFKKLLQNSKEKTNMDLIIGSTHRLLKAVSEDGVGEIKVNGVVWNVSSSNGQEIAEGEKVKIIEVKGNKLIAEKED